MVKPGAVSLIGLLLVVTEVLWLSSWIALGAYYVYTEGYGVGFGRALTALASPHAGLLPALMSIRFDVSTHCNKNFCSALAPPVTWFVMPLLAVPFDVLELFGNVALSGSGSLASIVLSSFGLFTSMSVSAFSALAYFTIYHAVSDNATSGSETVKHKLRFMGDSRSVSYVLR